MFFRKKRSHPVSPMSLPLHIGMLVDASREYGRGIYRGVARYATAREDWVILAHERPELDHLPDWIEAARLDALIAYIPNRRLYDKIRALKIPVVDVHGRCRGATIPGIETDAEGVVCLALDFFDQSGFQNRAFCGYPGVFFSDQREQAFRLHSGGACYAPAEQQRVGEDLYRFEKSSANEEADLVRWLMALPKPVAVLACNDIRGQQIIRACRESGLRVPEEVAVLGVDNDPMVCQLCRPMLSSIEPDVEAIGALAAEWIAEQLAGRPVPARRQIAPRRVVQRASTDRVEASHPAVLEAARLISSREFHEASVEQICERTGLSRSTLDQLFVQALGRTMAGEIARKRLQQSQVLLCDTPLSLREIAAACGFSSATYFCRFFKRQTGQTPDGYRRAQQR